MAMSLNPIDDDFSWQSSSELSALVRALAALAGLREADDYFMYNYSANGQEWTCLFVREVADAQRYARVTDRQFLQPAPSLDASTGLAHGKRGHRPPVTTALPGGRRLTGDSFEGAYVRTFQCVT
jgi:hypothetical protein